MLQWLPWPDAVAMATGTAVATRYRRLSAWARELTLLLALYALWQYAGALSIGRTTAALSRGLDIWHLERRLHLPDEAALQRPLLPHHTVLHLANVWYADVHVPALGALLLWCFWRHRDRYPTVRWVVVGVTAASLLVALWPVAPPRLEPLLGVVDVGTLIGPSTYAAGAPGVDQLSAMPSLHVGWALLVGGGVVWASSSRWRWLAVAHPVVTMLVVTVTGNHYEADGIVAAVLVAAACALVAAQPRIRASMARRSPSSSKEATGDPKPARASAGAIATS